MPLVRIDLFEGRSEEMKEGLIKEVSEAVVRALQVPPDSVQVILYEVPRKHWGRGGVPFSKANPSPGHQTTR